MSGKNCFIINLKLTFAYGCNFTVEKPSSERTYFIGEQYAVEVIIFMLDYSGLISIIDIIMILQVILIIFDPDM